MSIRATLYAKELRICPSGEPVSKLEKLVLYALADYHQDKFGNHTFPSVGSLADESLMDDRSCRRILASLERKGVITREHGDRQGRGHVTFYLFCELDSKGGQSDLLSKSTISFPKGDKRGTKGGQKEDSECVALDKQGTVNCEQKQIHPLTPASQGDCVSNEEAGDDGKTKRSTARVESCMPAEIACDPSPTASDVDLAVSSIMTGCGFTKRRLRGVIKAQIELHLELGENLDDIAKRMIAAWRKYVLQDCSLRVKWGPRNFIDEGHWADERGWHWDTQLIREKRMANEARVGSW
jgi:hypothetical protein